MPAQRLRWVWCTSQQARIGSIARRWRILIRRRSLFCSPGAEPRARAERRFLLNFLHGAMPAIEIVCVQKRYPKLQALNNISLTIEEGEFFGLLGPNGAGKTTLIHILAGLTRADGGRVRICGRDTLSDFRAARRMLGVVPQELVFDPFFTVRETLRIQSGYYGLLRNDDWIDEVLANLGLADKADANMR